MGDTAQSTAKATEAMANVAHETMLADGPEDWQSCSVVLRANGLDDLRVIGWVGVAWSTSGETQALRIRSSHADTINAFRAATTADPQQAPWVSALLQFDSDGKSRVQYEDADNARWWRDPSEQMDDYLARLKPEFS